MTQQTAVEWLWNTLIDTYNLAGISPGQEHLPDGILSYLEQAKQMEKEQIVDAYYGQSYSTSVSNGEQYYNQTYKNK